MSGALSIVTNLGRKGKKTGEPSGLAEALAEYALSRHLTRLMAEHRLSWASAIMVLTF